MNKRRFGQSEQRPIGLKPNNTIDESRTFYTAIEHPEQTIAFNIEHKWRLVAISINSLAPEPCAVIILCFHFTGEVIYSSNLGLVSTALSPILPVAFIKTGIFAGSISMCSRIVQIRFAGFDHVRRMKSSSDITV